MTKVKHRFYQPAVLGASETGIKIAALLANAGFRVRLYERAVSKENQLTSKQLISSLFQREPSPLSGIEAASLIIPSTYHENSNDLCEHDIVFECYEADLVQKRAWLTRLCPRLSRSAVVISVAENAAFADLNEALPVGMRHHFIGAHFSVMPRFHRLVELVPTARTETRVIEQMLNFFRDALGMVPEMVIDRPNLLANRVFIFALCNAFRHAQRQNLSVAELETATALIFGREREGICFLASQMGFAHCAEIYQRIEEDEKARFRHCLQFPPLLKEYITTSSTKTFYDFSQNPAKFFTTKPPVSTLIQYHFMQRDWLAISSDDSPTAKFIQGFLQDFWQYLAYLSDDIGLEGKKIDYLLLHAFGWLETPWSLLQEFSPAAVYKTTKQAVEKKEVQYPLMDKWKRQHRAIKIPLARGDEFTKQCHLIAENQHSLLHHYREQLIVWQPKEAVLDLTVEVLKDLTATVKLARRKQNLLMIYHHGKQFGVTRQWYSPPPESYLRANMDALVEAIMALRMFPYPVIFSGRGTILDAGFALMMQTDRVIIDAEIYWRLTTLDYQLPSIGAVWFEWLRRLPPLSAELSQLQIHTVLKMVLESSGIHNIQMAREIGLLRTHDRFVMNPARLPLVSQRTADAWLDSAQVRPARYALHKPSAEDIAWHYERSHQCEDPQRYRDLVDLLVTSDQEHVLSLRRFLRNEAALFYRYLYGENHDIA